MKLNPASIIVTLTLGITGCATVDPKPVVHNVTISKAKTNIESANNSIKSAEDKSEVAKKEIIRLKSLQDRADYKSILLLKWLELGI